MKPTPRSSSGVAVMRLVTPPSTLVTNTSPRAMNAISLPLGATAISRAPLVTGTTRSRLALASAEIATATFWGLPPGFIV